MTLQPVTTKASLKTKGETFLSITLGFSLLDPDGNPVFTEVRTGYEEPLPGLQKSLNQLLPWAIETACLNLSWHEYGIVSGVTIKQNRGETEGYCATVQHRFEGRVQCVTSRFKALEELTDEETEILHQIDRQCIAYLEGDRKTKQLNLWETHS